MRRILTVAASAAVALSLCLGAPATAAGRPTIDRFPKGDIDLGNLNDGPTGDVCSFPVHAVVHAIGPGHVILFNGQGVAYAGMTFGAFRIEFTNLDTGKTIIVNSSGPGAIDATGLPVLARGPWVIFEPMARGGIRFLHGRSRLLPTNYGVHAVLLSGREEDLCDRLA